MRNELFYHAQRQYKQNEIYQQFKEANYRSRPKTKRWSMWLFLKSKKTKVQPMNPCCQLA
ncbi:hypothetical protein [Alkalihalobacillus sp. LMS39]|uniref:hypothetical protein n=1 Tax=Alkalihalobacillus sp. LMS39 TaxID=2924032 RepID=UPI001FB436BE|nr:hypothetical protein [Alkalihalobacillus sp. LMS39]UOE95404.1 hypothetical protein MM271_07255 [Alkalihalobacillus sp. LMS39]